MFRKWPPVLRHSFLILVTALITYECTHLVAQLRRRFEQVWLISAVKAPGAKALEEIEADLLEGRTELATLKLGALRAQWKIFNSEDGLSGNAIGHIMVTFGRIENCLNATNNARQADGTN